MKPGANFGIWARKKKQKEPLLSGLPKCTIFLIAILSVGCSSELSTIDSTGQCVGCDLSKLEFNKLKSTTGLNLEGVQIKEAVIKDIKFKNVNFSGANFESVVFENVEFDGGDYSASSFKNITFNNVIISDGSDFSEAIIDAGKREIVLNQDAVVGVSFHNAVIKNGVISNVDFSESNLSGAVFEKITLRDVKFRAVDLTESMITESAFDNVQFSQGTDLSYAKIEITGEKVSFGGVSIDGLSLRVDVQDLEFNGITGRPDRIYGKAEVINFDSDFEIRFLSDALVQSIIAPFQNQLGGVYQELLEKYRIMKDVVVTANLKMSHLNNETGQPVYNPYTPDLIKNKLSNNGFANLSDLFRGQGWEQDKLALKNIYDDLSPDGKKWYDALSSDRARFIHGVYLEALNYSGARLCLEPALPQMPRTNRLDMYEWAKLIVLNNNFDPLIKEANDYLLCMDDSKVSAYDQKLDELSSGLDEIASLGRRFAENKRAEEQAAQRKIELARESFENQVTDYIKEFYKNDKIDEDYLKTLAAVKVQRLSQREKMRMMMDPSGMDKFIGSMVSQLYDQIISCPSRYFRNSMLDGISVLDPGSNEARFNLQVLDLLTRVKNEGHEVSDVDLDELVALGFSPQEVAVRIEKGGDKLRNCLFDAMTNF